MGKLTAIAVKHLTKTGRHTDGAGLHLYVRPDGRRGWVLRFMRNGTLRDMGLGGYPDVSLKQAREAAVVAWQDLKNGRDPIQMRRQRFKEELSPSPERTFRKAAERYIASNKSAWSNQKHEAQWASSLKAYVYPVLGDIAVSPSYSAHARDSLADVA